MQLGMTDMVRVRAQRNLGETEALWRETERLQSHLGETEIPIGETDLPRVCGSGYDIQTRWRIGRAEFDFRFWTYVWKWESS